MWFSEPQPSPSEDHLPDWLCQGNKVTKGDGVDIQVRLG